MKGPKEATLLSVNNEPIGEQLIADEVDQLRPRHHDVFRDMPDVERERQLREWATENVIDSVLLFQAAMLHVPPLADDELQRPFEALVRSNGGKQRFSDNLNASKEYRFLVGLSLDGPEHVHDKYRVTRGGKGSWSAVAEKASLLMEEGDEVNALSVVTDYSAHFAEEIYEYLRSLGFRHMQFIPCMETDPIDRTKAVSYSISADGLDPLL